jgi:predicted secreted protein
MLRLRRATPVVVLAVLLALPGAAMAKTVTVTKKSSGHTLHLAPGDTLEVKLVESPGQGSFWTLTKRPSRSVLTKKRGQLKTKNETKDGMPIAGAPQTHIFVWKAKAAGTTSIRLGLGTPDPKHKYAERASYTVIVR